MKTMIKEWHVVKDNPEDTPRNGEIVFVTFEDHSNKDPMRYVVIAKYKNKQWICQRKASGVVIAWKRINVKPYTDDWKERYGD
jgi:hypothetical protein